MLPRKPSDKTFGKRCFIKICYRLPIVLPDIGAFSGEIMQNYSVIVLQLMLYYDFADDDHESIGKQWFPTSYELIYTFEV